MRQLLFLSFILATCGIALASEFAGWSLGSWSNWLPTSPERFTLWLVPPLMVYTIFELRSLRSTEKVRVR